MWKYHNINFDYWVDYDDRDWPWSGHVFFAYDLVRNVKPKNIVELGTHRGNSFYSFCQGLKDDNSKGEAYAVDSWEGDEHAGTVETGYDPEGDYMLVRDIIRKHYGKQNIRLMKMFFDEAIEKFEDGSVEILHIDGLHTYDAVKHDYESWSKKLSKDHVVLLHDVAVADFGVWKFWEELKPIYKDGIYFDFKHSHGLGVVATGEMAKKMKDITKDMDGFRRHYEFIDLQEKFDFYLTRQKEDIEEMRLLNDEISNLREENNLLKHENINQRDEMKQLRNAFDQLSAKLHKKEQAYNSLVTRKVVRVYRKALRIMGKDLDI